MKNSFYTIILILILGQASHFGLPWWGLAPIAAIAGWLFPQRTWSCLLAGFAGGFLLWITVALWLDTGNEGMLSARIGTLFMGLSRWAVLATSGVLGGLIGGMGCLTGTWAGSLFGRTAA
ncbi:MAG: hypothetical protein EP344_18305 [Bacteroidetes bacterium]|nr:MAG: hypothetical protein EP344_18305 [Bacteroidota bacterium]